MKRNLRAEIKRHETIVDQLYKALYGAQAVTQFAVEGSEVMKQARKATVDLHHLIDLAEDDLMAVCMELENEIEKQAV